MSHNEPISVTCCFCGDTLDYEHATKLVVVPPNEEGSDQVLYCHGEHLRAAILSDIVLLPSVSSDEE